MMVRGQVHGGVAQGLGQALLERTGYDATRPARHRQLHGLRNAARRRSAGHRVRLNVVPCRSNPLGVKGAGEAGCVGSPPALINAIVDALSRIRRRPYRHAGDPEAVWRAIRNATSRQAA